MKWEEAISQIESPQFDAYLNAAIGTNAFFKAIGKDSAVQSAFSQLQKSGALQEDVLSRLYELSEIDVDHDYANPNDTVLAVLLWLSCFAFSEHALVQVAAGYVNRAPQCWYAKKLVDRILNPPPIQGGNKSAVAYGDRLQWGSARNTSIHSAIPTPGSLRVKVRSVIDAIEPEVSATHSYRIGNLNRVVGAAPIVRYRAPSQEGTPSISRASKPRRSFDVVASTNYGRHNDEA